MSKRDKVVDPSGAELLLEGLASEQKELIWLHHSNHVVMLDRERDLVFERVNRFLGSDLTTPDLVSLSTPVVLNQPEL